MSVTLTQLYSGVSTANQAGWWKPFDTDFLGNEYFASCINPITGEDKSNHNVMIQQRKADGTIITGFCQNRDNGGILTFVNDTGHNNPSIAVDAKGYIHVFTSMHVNRINYFRSSKPFDVTSLEQQFFDWPDSMWTYTYPVLVKDAVGSVYVLMRSGIDQSTTLTNRMGVLYKWTVGNYPAKKNKWDRFKVIFWDSSHSYYPDDLRLDSSGSINIIYEIGPIGAGTLRHRGTFIKITSGGIITDVAGSALQTPLDTSASQAKEVYQPLVTGEDYLANDNANLNLTAGVQTAKIIWDTANKKSLGIAFRYRPMRDTAATTFGGFGLRIATWNSSAWVLEDLFSLDSPIFSTSAAISALAVSGVMHIYFSLEVGGKAVLCKAVGTPGSWKYYKLTDKYTLPLRFQIEDFNGTHIGLLTAPSQNLLWRIMIDANLVPLTSYDTADALMSAIV